MNRIYIYIYTWYIYAEIWEIHMETPIPRSRTWVEDAGSTNPLPHLPLNGEATKPTWYVKKRKKGRPMALRGQEQIAKHKLSHRHATRNGGEGAGNLNGQKSEKGIQKRRRTKTNTEGIRHPLRTTQNTLPTTNPGNVSCPTNEWLDCPDQPRH